MSVTGYQEDSIVSVSFKVGVGVMYKITPTFELLAGVDIQARSWQEVLINTTIIETSEKSTKVYFGTNLHF